MFRSGPEATGDIKLLHERLDEEEAQSIEAANFYKDVVDGACRFAAGMQLEKNRWYMLAATLHHAPWGQSELSPLIRGDIACPSRCRERSDSSRDGRADPTVALNILGCFLLYPGWRVALPGGRAESTGRWASEGIGRARSPGELPRTYVLPVRGSSHAGNARQIVTRIFRCCGQFSLKRGSCNAVAAPLRRACRYARFSIQLVM